MFRRLRYLRQSLLVHWGIPRLLLCIGYSKSANWILCWLRKWSLSRFEYRYIPPSVLDMFLLQSPITLPLLNSVFSSHSFCVPSIVSRQLLNSWHSLRHVPAHLRQDRTSSPTRSFSIVHLLYLVTHHAFPSVLAKHQVLQGTTAVIQRFAKHYPAYSECLAMGIY